MSKTGISTLMILFLSLRDARGNPLASHDVGVNNELIRNSRSFISNIFGEPFSHRSWLLPVPPLPFSNLYKGDTNDMTMLMNKVKTLEENQEKILKLLTQLTDAPKATSCVSPAVPTSNDHSKIKLEDILLPSHKLNPIIIDIPNIKEETHEDTNQHEMSVSKSEVKYNSNKIEITPTQIAKPKVVIPIEPDNSPLKLDSNENTDKGVEFLVHSELENSSINEKESTETNISKKLDSKSEVKYDDLLSINSNKNEIPPTQVTNEKIVKPTEPDNSPLKLDSNENTDKGVEFLVHSELENSSINEKESTEANVSEKLDSKSEVKYDDLLSINSNKNEILPTQVTNEKVVKPTEPDNSPLKLDSNENTDKGVEFLVHSELENSSINEKESTETNISEKLDSKSEVKYDDLLSINSNKSEILPTQVTNENVVKPIEPDNSPLKLDSNENTDKEVEFLVHSELENSSINEKESTETIISEKLGYIY